jgi:hypothetical protein
MPASFTRFFRGDDLAPQDELVRAISFTHLLPGIGEKQAATDRTPTPGAKRLLGWQPVHAWRRD